ncbi:hypothetical protein F511_19603 [Dorcoceras hygrometricum]|uniref:Uncharacterized protein n=1 Tax=Dorcoceras hygrometricum TaxID=472368 RepID=A0A2Z7BN71_9LAMI|nr:hypothetical protein F511_19603 [Dorcoceras hygrometricum]
MDNANHNSPKQGYQESSVDKAQRLSCEDLINHHHLVIFRCDDSADHHKAMVFRHDNSAGHHIKSSVGPFRLDDSADRSQREKELSSQRNQAQYIPKLYRAPLSSQQSLKWKEITYPKLLKNRRATVLTSKDFPPLKIISAKTVGTYVAKSKNISVEDVDDEPAVAKVVKKAASKRRPAPAVVEPVLEKKRTTVGRPLPADKNLALVTVAQDAEPISTITAVTPRAPRSHAPKRKLVLPEGSDDEIVDSIIHLVIADTAAIESGEPDLEEPVIKETAEKETDVREQDVVEPVVVEIYETVAFETENMIDVSSITNYDEEPVVRIAEEKEAEKQKEIEPVVGEPRRIRIAPPGEAAEEQ